MKRRVRAFLIDTENRLVLIKRVKPEREYWVLPGGEVEANESLEGALKRECKEEVGVDIAVEKLAYEKELIRDGESAGHEYFYVAKILSGKIGTGQGPEFQNTGQYQGTHEIHSVKLDQIKYLNLLPPSARKYVITSFHD